MPPVQYICTVGMYSVNMSDFGDAGGIFHNFHKEILPKIFCCKIVKMISSKEKYPELVINGTRTVT